jgi:hypothetical protein
MAHSIVFKDFQGFDLLLTTQVRELIEMFYRGGDTKFVIYCDEKEPKNLGHASFDAFARTFTVMLCRKNIVKWFESMGLSGGDLKAPDVRVAAASVLVHELKHCDQMTLHKGNGIFWGQLGGSTADGRPRMKRYRGRACEREARAYADEKLNEICAYFGLPPVARRPENRAEDHEELDAVIDLLAEIDNPSMDDIKDELRASGLLRPNNVMIVRKELSELSLLHDANVVG